MLFEIFLADRDGTFLQAFQPLLVAISIAFLNEAPIADIADVRLVNLVSAQVIDDTAVTCELFAASSDLTFPVFVHPTSFGIPFISHDVLIGFDCLEPLVAWFGNSPFCFLLYCAVPLLSRHWWWVHG